jgi:hypothetical protein
VDQVHAAMPAAGAEVSDPPADYSGRPGYSQGYYAAFYADPCSTRPAEGSIAPAIAG